jgi:predicted pyridoxine 5'-phosphate oxidase superfamily flavin-nucleotide-binding protein
VGILTAEMKRVVAEARLGFVATVCADGTPNLSPKGTVAAWDDDHLVFIDLRSPGTVENLRSNPAIEVNVVDQLVRKGYRFKGTATLVENGPVFDEIAKSRRDRGLTPGMKTVVIIRVERALEITSPDYDRGVDEDDVRGRWRSYWRELWRL